jgi:hypothetical protein
MLLPLRRSSPASVSADRDFCVRIRVPGKTTFSFNPLDEFGFPGPGLPDLIGDPKPAHLTKDNWINPAAFAGQAPNTPFDF